VGFPKAKCFGTRELCFFAGADSTTNSMLWLIYNLGRFPDVQTKLRNEIRSVKKPSEPLTPGILKNLRYLRDTVKESLRLTPTIPGLFRILDEPIVVSGYQIPAKIPIVLMMYNVSEMDQYFPEANKFKPERWHPSDPSQKPNPFIHLPFGWGPRMCQGFRVSELEMYIALTKLVENFEWETTAEATPYAESFIRPEKPLEIKWKVLS